MSSLLVPRRPERPRREVEESGPRRHPPPHVRIIARQSFGRCTRSIALLTRSGPRPEPLVSIQNTYADGSRGARLEFRLEDLADLEAAIALARASVSG